MTATPTLSEVIKSAIETRLVDLHSAMPGEVVSFNPSTQMADVQPALKRKFVTSQGTRVEALPVIPNVPVVFPRSSNAIVYFPLQKGDSVLLIFSERSIDRWAQNGGVVDPADTRKHSLSDALCIPGPWPQSGAFEVADPSKMNVQFGDALIQLSDDGKFKIGVNGNAQLELIDLFSKTLEQLVQAQTAVGPLLNAAQFAQLKTLLDQMKG
jgi:hypothetical protein